MGNTKRKLRTGRRWIPGDRNLRIWRIQNGGARNGGARNGKSPKWKSPEIEDPKIDNPKMKEARKPRGLLTACPFFFIGITWGTVM